MAGFDYGAFFGPILPLADATRQDDERVWGDGAETDKRSHDYVLYLGCNVLRTVALAETIVALLERLGVDFVPLGGPATCCGVIHHTNGAPEISENLTRQTLSKFEGYAPKAVLTYCPSCHAHMNYALDAGGIEFDVPYLHVTEFIVENLHRLDFANRVERKVYLHVHGGAEQSDRDARFARTILEAIPGLEVVGGTAVDGWAHDCSTGQIAKIGADRQAGYADGLFADATAHGVDAVAALYHSCYRTLCTGIADYGVDVIHYTGLVAEALGLPVRDEDFERHKLRADPDVSFAELKDRAAARGVGEKRLRATLDSQFRPK